jgi:hypothetical protein
MHGFFLESKTAYLEALLYLFLGGETAVENHGCLHACMLMHAKNMSESHKNYFPKK